MCPGSVGRCECEQEGCSWPLMISHSHIPVIADHYSLVCSARPERCAFGQPCTFLTHCTPVNPPPHFSLFLSRPVSLCLLCRITLLFSEICEISILCLLPLAAFQAIKGLVCDAFFNNISLFGPAITNLCSLRKVMASFPLIVKRQHPHGLYHTITSERVHSR